MELRRYFRVLKKHIPIIIALTVLLGAAGLAITTVQKPVVEAKATCLIEPIITLNDTISAREMMDRIMPTLSNVVASDYVMAGIVEKTGGIRSIEELRDEIKSEVIDESYIIAIAVQDRERAIALEIAKAAYDSLSSAVNGDNLMGLNYNTSLLKLSIESKTSTSPSPLRNGLIGGFLGLFLGIGLASLLGYLDTSIKSKEELAAIVELPVIGQIPLIPAKKGKERSDEGKDDLGVLESGRTIRTNILNLGRAKAVRVILVASPNPRDGRSFVGDQLARAFAASGKQTVLVDADLRKAGHMHGGSPGTTEVGLVDLVAGGLELTGVLRNTDISTLKLLPSGSLPRNPSEILGSAGMQAAVEELRSDFEMIVLDSSPIELFADAVVLASIVDEAILVVAAESTSRASIRAALASLSATNVTLLGTVLNKVRLSTTTF